MRRCFYQIGPMRISALPFGEKGMGKGKRELPWGVVRTQPYTVGRVTTLYNSCIGKRKGSALGVFHQANESVAMAS